MTQRTLIPFPGNRRPVDSVAVARGGADVLGFPHHVELSEFARDYVIAALWSSTDGTGPLDERYGIPEIATPTLEQMANDCAAFERDNAELFAAAYAKGYDVGRAGHDFWLTRNRHGIGYWDRKLGEIGRKLTDAAYAVGEYTLYVGDDGMIHGCRG